MECKFVVGQRVLCVEDDWSHPLVHLVPHLPVLKSIYTVRDIEVASGVAYLRFREIINPILKPLREPNFDHRCFRALNERPAETSIEVFKSLLTPTKILEDA